LCEVPNIDDLTHEFGTCVDNVNFTGGFMERMPVIEGWTTTMFWAATWIGTLSVQTGGTYGIRLDAGIMDSAALTINGALAGSFECQGGEVTVDLPAGDVSFQVTYSDYGWTDKMVMNWNGPDSGNQWDVVPAKSFKTGNSCNSAPEPEPEQPKCPYNQLGGESGCGVAQSGYPQMHESCMCFKGFGEDDIMPWCESACDDDENCKGYVERAAFGMQTCMLATMSTCPTDHMCNKMNAGSTGDLVAFNQPFAGFKGCFVKDCPASLVQDSDDQLSAIHAHATEAA